MLLCGFVTQSDKLKVLNQSTSNGDLSLYSSIGEKSKETKLLSQ